MIPLLAAASAYDSLLKIFIFVFAVGLLIYLFAARRLLKTRPPRVRDRLAPDLWFYSALVDIEIGNAPATARHLTDIFFLYLQRRYKLPNAKPETAFELVKQHETDERLIERYGEIYNTALSLKQNPRDDVIAYARQLKKAFNAGVAPQAAKQDCNNC